MLQRCLCAIADLLVRITEGVEFPTFPLLALSSLTLALPCLCVIPEVQSQPENPPEISSPFKTGWKMC